MNQIDLQWQWEETDAGRSVMSGDIAKLFKHENQKTPGVLAVNPPSQTAALLAREVIQNSWDAARDLQKIDEHVPDFEIEFRFKELAAREKASLVDALDLGGLAERVRKINPSDVGLETTDCLDGLADESQPLRVLQITERAASGMYGPWIQNRSKMYLALLSIGYTEKLTGSGGSYGYGKAGLINGSKTRTVVAYTCFREQDEEPDVTRRLLAVTYWGQHDVAEINYPGIATLSAASDGKIRPFENDSADAIAEVLGFETRTSEVPDQLGTTFLLLDPALEPRDLVGAIERNWWPALYEGDFVASVVDYDGSTLRPRPMKDPTLHTFIEAWELARGRSAAGDDDWVRPLTGPNLTSEAGAKKYPTVGTLALKCDLDDWSYADQKIGTKEDTVAHKSLVALTRSPRMVVEYFEAGGSTPYLRGVFIADDSTDDFLRQTEPKAHDAWRGKVEDGKVDTEAAILAGHVLKRIKQTVNNQRQRLQPDTPPPEDINLPFFNKIMRQLMSGMGGGVRQPVPETRPITIQLDYKRLVAEPDGQIKLEGTATYALSEHFEGDRASVLLSIAYRFIEDERVGEHARLSITPPEGFKESSNGEFVGELKRGSEVRFEFTSDPYESTWTGRLFVNGEIRSEVVELNE